MVKEGGKAWFAHRRRALFGRFAGVQVRFPEWLPDRLPGLGTKRDELHERDGPPSGAEPDGPDAARAAIGSKQFVADAGPGRRGRGGKEGRHAANRIDVPSVERSLGSNLWPQVPGQCDTRLPPFAGGWALGLFA